MTTIIQLERTELQELIEASVQKAVSEAILPRLESPQDRITDIEKVKSIINQGESWIYKHTMKNCPDPLPHQKFGKRLVFSRKQLEEWRDQRTSMMPTPDEIMSDRLSKSAKKRL
jgi:predicted DNA-binding transcriptional regulator AlpA